MRVGRSRFPRAKTAYAGSAATA